MKKYKEYQAKVLRIIDGDTIVVDIDLGFGIKYKSKLRFFDYDAPETYRPSCPEEKLLGLEAKEYLMNELELNKPLTIKTIKDKKGKYGRILCRIFVEDKDIIEEMIDLGFTKKAEWK